MKALARFVLLSVGLLSPSWRRNSSDYSSGCENKIIVLWFLTFKQDPSPPPMLFSRAFQFCKGTPQFPLRGPGLSEGCVKGWGGWVGGERPVLGAGGGG